MPETFHSAHLLPRVNAQFSLCMTCFLESSTRDYMGHRETPHYGLRDMPTVAHMQPTNESRELQPHVLTASVLIHGDRREQGRKAACEALSNDAIEVTALRAVPGAPTRHKEHIWRLCQGFRGS